MQLLFYREEWLFRQIKMHILAISQLAFLEKRRAIGSEHPYTERFL